MKPPAKPPVVLVFGEDDHDRQVLVRLLRALHPSAPHPEARRAPLVLIKGREKARAQKNALDIAKQVQLTEKLRPVAFVVAHQDCDAIEPAHLELGDEIERRLEEIGITAVAATPAWETEAWLYLWPDAVPAVNHRWSRPSRDGQQVGLITNAKETFTRELGGDKRRYEEADSVRIIEKACELNLITTPKAKSASYERFCARLAEVVDGA